MKIALVNNQYQLGGAETVIRQVHTGLKKAGHESRLHIAFGKTYPAEVIPFYPRLLSRLRHTRFSSTVESLAPLAEWSDRAFRKLAVQAHDIVHIHNFHGNYASIESLAYLAGRKPVVWTFHAFWGITGGCDHPRECQRYQQQCGQCPNLGEWPIGPVDGTAVQLRTKLEFLAGAPLTIVSPSRHLADKVRNSQVGKAWRVLEIPNGVDPSQFSFQRKRDAAFRQSLGILPETTAILVVNRNFKDPGKGFPMVEEALAAIDPAGVQVILAGHHSEWAASRLPAGLAKVDAGYVNSRERLAALFEAADIFLFASLAENFPCVILEAMSSKCCVVATPTSGVTEQIDHRNTGYLAERLSGKSLGNVLCEALSHREKQALLGENARRQVEREFSEQVMVDRHIALYRELMQNAR